jgi:hypothetical protein
MADNLCPVCGANPCYRICPTQDPYHGDQAAENADYEFNARYDDNRERYAATAADAELAMMPDEDAEYIAKGETGAEQELRRAVVDSVSEGFRPNDDGTVTYISPTGGEHTYDPADLFSQGED